MLAQRLKFRFGQGTEGHGLLRRLSVKNSPADARDAADAVRSLKGEDPLWVEMAAHSNILAWKTPWTEKSEATVHGVAKGQTQQLSVHAH